MRLPYHLFRWSTFRSEPLLAGMAAVAVGMFVGTWVIGPAITRNSDAPAPAAHERPSYDDMVSRPDPSPYRAATPAFEQSGVPHYAAAAKAQAQAQIGGDVSDDAMAAQEPYSGQRRANFPVYDRHRVY